MDTLFPCGCTRCLLASALMAVVPLAVAAPAPPALEGNTLLSTDELLAGMSPALRAAPLQDWALYIRQRYQEAGYPAVQVRVLDGDAPRLRITEGRIASVNIQGHRFHDDANLLLPLQQLTLGAAPRPQRLLREIALSNENPSKQLAVTLEAGPRAGEILAGVTVSDSPPSRFSLSYDNDGSPTLGRDRVSLGYRHANLFNRDHVLVAQLGSSIDRPERNRMASLAYRLPFYGTPLALDVFGTYSESDTGQTHTPEGPLALTGRGHTLGLRLVQQLSPLGELRQKLLYGFDDKDFKNHCDSAGVALDDRACGSVGSRPLSLSHVSRWTSERWDGNLIVAYAANVPGGARGNSDYYQQLGKTAHWKAWRLQGNASAPLFGSWQLRLALAGQYSDDDLIVGEQFGLGGGEHLRGYQERSVSGERGYSASLELRTPEWSRPVGGQPLRVHGLLFFDDGRVSSSQQPAYHLSSVGLGLRLNWNEAFSLRLDAGCALRDLSITTPGADRQKGDVFVHVKASYHF